MTDPEYLGIVTSLDLLDHIDTLVDSSSHRFLA